MTKGIVQTNFRPMVLFYFPAIDVVDRLGAMLISMDVDHMPEVANFHTVSRLVRPNPSNGFG